MKKKYTLQNEWSKDGRGHDQFKIGKGRLYLFPTEERGTPFVSSFGPNSEDSFSGFVPDLKDREEIKTASLKQAAKLWLNGPMDRIARHLLSA